MERRSKNMLMIALGVIIGLLGTTRGMSQPCFGGAYRDTIIPTIAWQTYPCIKGGEYLEFTGQAGKFYTFSFCIAGGFNAIDTQLSLLDGSGNDAGGYADDECLLGSHLGFWFCPANGTYRILVNRFFCQTDVSCNVLAYKMEPDPGGPGTTCGNPYTIPSLPFTAGGFMTCGFGDDYTSSNACSSIYMDDEDFVFAYNGTAGECISIFTDNTYTYTGLFIVRGCPNVGGSTCIAADEASAGIPYLSNITLPTTATYYIILSGDGTVFPDCTPFDIEVMNCVAVGQGMNCATAFPIPSIPYSQNGFTTCGKGNTYTSADACGTNYMNGEDFVFSYVATGPECIAINITNSFSYTGLFVYDGCPNAVGTNCLASRGDPSGDPEVRQVNLPSAGTYYIMVSTWPLPNCTPFNFEILPCAAPCSNNPNGSDNCTSATSVSFTQGDTICGVANYYFTPDGSPSLTSAFCGSVENNSWFQFIADSTQMTIRIDVPDCMSGFGLQMQAFSTPDCINFTAVSNCWNPQYQTSGSLALTGLTIGQTYYLMIDGYAGDDCTYNLSRLGLPVLPVVWGEISATPQGEHVEVQWSTLSEQNVRGYHIQRGYRDGDGQDALRWQNVGYIEVETPNSNGRSYSHDDLPPYAGETWYYRIQQVDLDGLSEFSDVVEVQLDGSSHSELRSVFPVPASSEVIIRYYSAQPGKARLAVMDVQGKTVAQQDWTISDVGTSDFRLNTSSYSNGTYFFMLSIGQELLKGRFEILQ